MAQLIQTVTIFNTLQSGAVYLKTDGTTTGKEGASLPQLAAISRPDDETGRTAGQRDSLTDDGTSNMFSHTN